MPWSKSYLPKEVAEKKALEFVPQKIDLGAPEQAIDYLRRKAGSDFRMNEHVQVQTGVNKIEKLNDEEKIEARALEMLADIQQNAYQEAYQLGLDEGSKKAFDEISVMVAERMDEFAHLLGTISEMKKEILSHNEAHMVKLLFHMASRLAVSHLEQDNSAIVEVLRTAVALSQEEEKVTVQLNPGQVEFIEELKKRTGREFDFLKKIHFEPNAEVRAGGCIVETNYGEIDSRIEQRIEQLWSSLGEMVPRVKDKISGNG